MEKTTNVWSNDIMKAARKASAKARPNKENEDPNADKKFSESQVTRITNIKNNIETKRLQLLTLMATAETPEAADYVSKKTIEKTRSLLERLLSTAQSATNLLDLKILNKEGMQMLSNTSSGLHKEFTCVFKTLKGSTQEFIDSQIATADIEAALFAGAEPTPTTGEGEDSIAANKTGADADGAAAAAVPEIPSSWSEEKSELAADTKAAPKKQARGGAVAAKKPVAAKKSAKKP